MRVVVVLVVAALAAFPAPSRAAAVLDDGSCAPAVQMASTSSGAVVRLGTPFKPGARITAYARSRRYAVPVAVITQAESWIALAPDDGKPIEAVAIEAPGCVTSHAFALRTVEQHAETPVVTLAAGEDVAAASCAVTYAPVRLVEPAQPFGFAHALVGEVDIAATVDASGHALSPRAILVTTDRSAVQPMLEAVRGSRFEPMIFRCEPVAAVYTYRMRFGIQRI